MTSRVLIHLLLIVVLFYVTAALDFVCKEYTSKSGVYKPRKSCFYGTYCCGTCNNRYCCRNVFDSLDQNFCKIKRVTNPVIGVVGVIAVVSCCCCSYCCLHKMCRKPRPVVETSTTTVVNTPCVMQQPPVQGGQYPPYQPVPTQPPYGGQPYPAESYAQGPNPAQPYAQGPNPAQPYAQGPNPAQPYAQGPNPAQPYAQGPNPAQPYEQGPNPAQPYGQEPYQAQPYAPGHPPPYQTAAVVGMSTTTVVNTQCVMQQPPVQGGQYPPYQPVPTQPPYGGQPYLAQPYAQGPNPAQPYAQGPNPAQPYASGPPPPYQTVAGPGYPSSQAAYPPTQEGFAPMPQRTDTSKQPPYNPAFMQPPPS